MRDKSILVTGGAGFIGSNFVHRIVDKFEDVYVLDKLTYAGKEENLNPVRDDILFFEGDVRSEDILAELYAEVDFVINFAAESHVDRSIEAGRAFVQSNVEGAFVAMDMLRDHDIERFVQLSTDEVYGSTEDGEYTESTSYDPSSPYSASKASADLFANALWETYDLPISIVRPTNVYGPRQHSEKLIPKFTLRALAGKPLPLYGDGSNVRQWLYVEDLSDCLLDILTTGGSESYNIGGPDRLSNLEVTKRILDIVGESEDLIEFVDDRKGHDQRYALDDDKLRDKVGTSPSTPFDEGIKRTVDWYRNNQMA